MSQNQQRQITKEEFQEKYGLKSLKQKIVNPRPEFAVLEKGVDVTTFGLNFSSE